MQVSRQMHTFFPLNVLVVLELCSQKIEFSSAFPYRFLRDQGSLYRRWCVWGGIGGRATAREQINKTLQDVAFPFLFFLPPVPLCIMDVHINGHVCMCVSRNWQLACQLRTHVHSAVDWVTFRHWYIHSICAFPLRKRSKGSPRSALSTRSASN